VRVRAVPAPVVALVSQSKARRRTGVAALAALSAITGYISYLHGYQIAILVGNPKEVAYWLPLVPDLMIVTSSMTLLEARATTGARPLMSMVALAAGIGWTVAQNVAAGLHDSTGNAVISAGVPLAFVLTFESLLWQFRQNRDRSHPATDAGPVDVADTLQRLVEHYGSQRRAVAELRIPRDHLRKLITAPADVALNGSGPHE
jgi:hypothetical protein